MHFGCLIVVCEMLEGVLSNFLCLKEVNEMPLGAISRIHGADHRMVPPKHTKRPREGQPGGDWILNDSTSIMPNIIRVSLWSGFLI